MSRLQGEVLAKLEAAYIAAVPFDDRPTLRETCHCPAFSFTHLAYAGECEGPQRGGELPHLEAA